MLMHTFVKLTLRFTTTSPSHRPAGGASRQRRRSGREGPARRPPRGEPPSTEPLTLECRGESRLTFRETPFSGERCCHQFRQYSCDSLRDRKRR